MERARLLSNRSAAYIAKHRAVSQEGVDLRGLLALAVADANAVTAEFPSWQDGWYRLYAAHAASGDDRAAQRALQTGIRQCQAPEHAHALVPGMTSPPTKIDVSALVNALESHEEMQREREAARTEQLHRRRQKVLQQQRAAAAAAAAASVAARAHEGDTHTYADTDTGSREDTAAFTRVREGDNRVAESIRDRSAETAMETVKGRASALSGHMERAEGSTLPSTLPYDGATPLAQSTRIDEHTASRTMASSHPCDVADMSASSGDVIVCSDKIRLEANDKFRAGDWNAAIEGYTRSIHLAHQAGVQPDRRAFSNRSAAWLRRAIETDEPKAFQMAIVDAERCIAIDATWPKAWFRKGSALLEDGRPALARAVLLQGLGLCPDNPTLLEALAQAETVIREEGEETDAEMDRLVGTNAGDAAHIGVDGVAREGQAHAKDANTKDKNSRVRRRVPGRSQRAGSAPASGVGADVARGNTVDRPSTPGLRRKTKNGRSNRPSLQRTREPAGASRRDGATDSEMESDTVVRLDSADVPENGGADSTQNGPRAKQRQRRMAPQPEQPQSQQPQPQPEQQQPHAQAGSQGLAHPEAHAVLQRQVPSQPQVRSTGEDEIFEGISSSTHGDPQVTESADAAAEASQVDMPDSLYAILGVAPDASDAVIRRSYYLAARELHPDKNPNDPAATLKFQRVSEAYQILSNPESRAMYDKHGEDGLDRTGIDAVDPQTLFAIVFGSDQFADFIGDLKLTSLASNVDDDGKAPSKEVLDNLQASRINKLTDKLVSYLDPWVLNDRDGFLRWAENEVQHLADTNFGPDLLSTVGNVYVHQVDIFHGKNQFLGIAGVLKDASYRRHKLSAQMKANAATSKVMQKQRRLHERVIKLNKEGTHISEMEAQEVAADMARNAVDMMWKISVLDIQSTLEAVIEKLLSVAEVSTDRAQAYIDAQVETEIGGTQEEEGDGDATAKADEANQGGVTGKEGTNVASSSRSFAQRGARRSMGRSHAVAGSSKVLTPDAARAQVVHERSMALRMLGKMMVAAARR